MNLLFRIIFKIFFTLVILFMGAGMAAGVRSAMGTKYSTGWIGPFVIYPSVAIAVYYIWKWGGKKNKKSNENNILKKD